MKQHLLSAIATALIFSSAAFAQQNSSLSCGLDDVIMNARVKNPNYDRQVAEKEKLRDQWKIKYANSTQSVITIPVVVHVVWNTAQQNISDSQVVSQINVLNTDYIRMNSDTVNTPSVFQTLAANPQIQFCLAQQDPQGNPTNGITRTQTSKTDFGTPLLFSGDTSIWNTSLGGYDKWDTSQYFNIWVCPLGSFIGGLGFWPGGTSLIAGSQDGVLINYTYFGTLGTATAPYNLGRTTTHEVGHYLDLHHLWGDVSSNSNCAATDYCNDTPTQVQATQNCPAFPFTDGCTSASPGLMFMDFMDYPPDNCKNMFTIDQSIRMNACLNGARASLLTSLACTPPVIGINDVSQMNAVNIFPNPTNSQFTVYGLRSTVNTIEVYNSLGQIVHKQTVNSKQETVNLSAASGVYSVKIYSEENPVVKKIIIE